MPLSSYNESYTISNCSNPSHCGVFRRVAARCTAGSSDFCPGGEDANGNTDPTLCDGAPVYQLFLPEDGSGAAGGCSNGAVLRRQYFMGQTAWYISPSKCLADCCFAYNSLFYSYRNTKYLRSQYIQGPSGFASTAAGYSAGDTFRTAFARGWLDFDANELSGSCDWRGYPDCGISVIVGAHPYLIPHGHCDVDNSCVCDHGFTGDRCEVQRRERKIN